MTSTASGCDLIRQVEVVSEATDSGTTAQTRVTLAFSDFGADITITPPA